MATTFQTSEILADVARLANVPAFSTTSNVTSGQCTYWLVQSARTLSALLRQRMGSDNDFVASASLTVPAGLGLVSLPADCGEVHAVLWVKSSRDYQLCDGASQDDLEEGSEAEQAWESPPTYRVEGQTLAVFPPSTDAEDLIVYYTTHLDLSGGATSYISRLDTDRWLTLDVLCKVLAAKQRDYSLFAAEKAQVEALLLSPARTRDPNTISTIRDTRGAAARRFYRNRWDR